MRRAPKAFYLLACLLISQAHPPTSHAQFGRSARTPVDLRDTVYLNVDTVAKSHLVRAEAYLRDGQWAEAIDIIEQVMDEFGEKIIQLAPNRYTSVRTYCNDVIAGFPRDALEEYRARIDPLAERWFREGLKRRDREILRQVIENALASSWGDEALNLFAELSLERGEFARARAAWVKILPPDEQSPTQPEMDRPFRYPDTNLALVDIKAKLVLTSILDGNLERARSELERFAEAHPHAEGVMAGSQGVYRERLAELIVQGSAWAVPETAASWTTFAGSPARTQRLPRAVDVGALQWQNKDLKPQRAATGNFLRRGLPRRTVANRKAILSYHPLLVDEVVLVSDDTSIYAYDVETGSPAWLGGGAADDAVIYSTPPKEEDRTNRNRSARLQAMGKPQFTMTAAGSRLFARLGYPVVSSPTRRRNFNVPAQPGSLVCLDLEAQGKFVWEIKQEGDWAFEGAPVADRENVYVAVRRNGGFMPEAHVVCYDVRTKAKKWDRLICQGTSLSAGVLSELSHNLLTLDEGVLYYGSNLGAVAALDARDGRIRWITTYPRSEANPIQGGAKHFQRDLNPCIVSEGTVLVAPSDSSLVLALDADSGRLKWQTDLLKDVVHLIGVGQGNLIATGDQVWAVDLETGKSPGDGPTPRAKPREHGRGVLVAGEVYWPVQEEIVVLRQSDGSLVRRISLKQHGVTGGNLLVAGGYLLVAQADGLVAFSQYSRLFDRYKDQIAERPDDALAHFQYARSAEAIERWDLAEASFKQAMRLTETDQLYEGEPLGRVAAGRLFHLRIGRAEAAAAENRLSAAVERYRDAARDAREPSQQLSALLHAAETLVKADEPAAAIETYQQVLADKQLRSQQVAVSEMLRLRSDLEVASRIEALIDEHGREVYAPIDEEAAVKLAAFSDAADSQALEALISEYPNASPVPAARLRLARQQRDQGNPARAAAAFRRLLQDSRLALNRAEMTLELARCYEQQGYWQQARRTWEGLAREDPKGDLSSFGITELAGRFAEKTLDLPPYASLPQIEVGPPLEMPLTRRWHRNLAGQEVLIPSGQRPDMAPANVFVYGDELECLAAEDGSVQWKISTSDRPRWLGYAGEHLLIGADQTVTAVYLSNGETAWQWSAESGLNGQDPLDTKDDSRKSDLLSDFVVAGPRLVLREGRSRLRALDAQTGSLAWSFEPAAGTLGPRFQCDRDLVSLQTVSPGRLVVLDTVDGRVRYEFETGDTLWTRAPLHLGPSRLCLVSDRVHVEMHDAERGGLLWPPMEGPSSPANGPPDVVGNSQHLLVVVNGYILQRVDPASGDVLWQKSLGTEPLMNPRALTALDATAVYCVSRGELKAFRLTDGALIWKRRVGVEGPWRVERLTDYVVCYPASRPIGGSAGKAPRGAAVFFFRKEDGTPVERLNFLGDAGGLNVQFSAAAAVVVGAENLWALGPFAAEP